VFRLEATRTNQSEASARIQTVSPLCSQRATFPFRRTRVTVGSHGFRSIEFFTTTDESPSFYTGSAKLKQQQQQQIHRAHRLHSATPQSISILDGLHERNGPRPSGPQRGLDWPIRVPLASVFLFVSLSIHAVPCGHAATTGGGRPLSAFSKLHQHWQPCALDEPAPGSVITIVLCCPSGRAQSTDCIDESPKLAELCALGNWHRLMSAH
jgi:hypothetical protein